jgi:hypothetical protein
MLAGCEFSGRVRDAFAARGWEAWSADLRPSESPVRYTLLEDGCHDIDQGAPPGTFHYQGDVRDLFKWDHPVNTQREIDDDRSAADLPMWDLAVLFPPCTHLSLAGARYWKAKQADGRQGRAADFFMDMVIAPAKRVAVENPVGYMGKPTVFRKPDQVVQPWWFGDPLRKATCLWLKNLPLLYADNTVIPTGRVTTGGGSHRVDIAAGRGIANGHEDGEGRARRDIVRSRTLPDFARAMADQWGPWIEAREQ